jgi:hypothetical protein
MAVGFREEPQTLKPSGKLVYLGACLIVGIRLARERQVARTVRVENAIAESIWLASEVLDTMRRKHREFFERET